MPAIIAMMAMIFRSMARAPVGGPPGASGSGTATRAAYHSTAPRTRSRKTAVISAGRLTWSTIFDQLAGAGVAWSVVATGREIALAGPVSTLMRPVPSILIGNMSIGRGAGPWMIWPYRL